MHFTTTMYVVEVRHKPVFLNDGAWINKVKFDLKEMIRYEHWTEQIVNNLLVYLLQSADQLLDNDPEFFHRFSIVIGVQLSERYWHQGTVSNSQLVWTY
jgi:hypothetical protein